MRPTPDNIENVARSLAYRIVLSKNPSEADLKRLRLLLTEEMGKPDEENTREITELYYQEAILLCRTTFFTFIENRLDKPELLLPTGQAIYDGIKTGLKGKQLLKHLKKHYPDLNHTIIINKIQIIRQRFELDRSFKPNLTDEELSQIHDSYWQNFLEFFSSDWEELKPFLVRNHKIHQTIREKREENRLSELTQQADEIHQTIREKCEEKLKSFDEKQTQLSGMGGLIQEAAIRLVDNVLHRADSLKSELTLPRKPESMPPSSEGSNPDSEEEQSNKNDNSPTPSPRHTTPERRKSRQHPLFSSNGYKELASHKLDVNRPDDSGKTLLHHALNQEDPNPDVIAILLANGARMDIKDKGGKTPLDSPNAEILFKVIDKETGNNPLHCAVIHGQLASFQAFFLFAKKHEKLYGPNGILNQQNKKNETPFDVTDNGGNSAFHLIANNTLSDEEAYLELVYEMMGTVEKYCRRPDFKPDRPTYFLERAKKLLLRKNEQHLTPYAAATLTAKQKWEAFQRVKQHNAIIERAFENTLHYLYRELNDLNKTSKKYKFLSLKLDEVHTAMHRIRKGENPTTVLDDLHDEISETTFCCCPSELQRLVKDIKTSSFPKLVKEKYPDEPPNADFFGLHADMWRHDKTSVVGRCNEIHDGIHDPKILFHKDNPPLPTDSVNEENDQLGPGSGLIFWSSDDPQGDQQLFEMPTMNEEDGLMDSCRPRNPFELTLWQAADSQRNYNDLLERMDHTIRAFAPIESYLTANAIWDKLDIAKKKRRAVEEGRLASLSVAFDDLAKNSNIQKPRHRWDLFHVPESDLSQSERQASNPSPWQFWKRRPVHTVTLAKEALQKEHNYQERMRERMRAA